jgi:hypothetical protein
MVTTPNQFGVTYPALHIYLLHSSATITYNA